MRSSVLALILVVAIPAPRAQAEAEESVVWSGVQSTSWTNLDVTPEASPLALGALVGVRYGLDDFWDVAIEVAGTTPVTKADAGLMVTQATVEARYTIDALTWVPWLCAGGGGLVQAGAQDRDDLQSPDDELTLDATLHMGMGIDYRPSRSWGLSFAVRAHSVVTDLDRTAGPLTSTVAYAWYLD